MNKVFSYNIAKNADNKAFLDTCALIESKISDAKKEKLLVDVDGSLVQTYRTSSGEIDVFNDYMVDAVYVDSEVNLEKVFLI